LDAQGCCETFDWLSELQNHGRTIVLVTHDMTLVAEHAQRALVLHEGQVIADEPPARLFRQSDNLARASLMPPPVVAAAQALQAYGLTEDVLTVDGFCSEYVTLLEGGVPKRGAGESGPTIGRLETPPKEWDG
jgi:ABC-type multidrug transport system ATPase subunit